MVSVVTAVYNGQRYVGRAIASVLGQTYGDFELIAVDDCSNDRTTDILDSVSDPRITVLRTAGRRGPGAARNLAFSHARGKYVALLDADDIAFPRRLEMQVRQLESRPELVAVSSPTVTIDEWGHRRGYTHKPCGSLAVRWFMIFYPSLAHPSAMIARRALSDRPAYETDITPAEDYELFVRLLACGEADNVPYPLVYYRRHDEQLTRTRRERQLECHDKVARAALAQELPGFAMAGDRFRAVWRHLAGLGAEGDPAELAGTYLDMLEAFSEIHAGDPRLPAVRRLAITEIARRSLRSMHGRQRLHLARRLVAKHRSAPVSVPLAMGEVLARRVRWVAAPMRFPAKS